MRDLTKLKAGGAVTLAAASLAVCAYTTYAIFADNKTEGLDITTGTVQVKLEEDAPFTNKDQPAEGNKTTSKTFRVVSTGNKRTYTRIALFPSIEYYDEGKQTWGVLGALSSKDLTYTISDETLAHWIDGGDGYYYYNDILTENTKTTDFVINNIQLGTIPIEYKDLAIRVNFYVEAEGIQATHQSYKINWNIDDIPEGVKDLPSYNDEAEVHSIPSYPNDPVADANGHQIQ